jgi:hypothetical protein
MSQNNRLWAIGAVTLMLVTLVAGWFLGAQPLLAASATADAERFSVDAQNASSQAEIAQLAADNENLPELQREYATLKQSIPTSADTSPFLNDLDTLAASAGVVVNGFTVAEPQAYTIPLSAVAPVVDPAAEEGAETDEPVAPVAPTTPVGYTPVTSPLITPENFVGIQFTIDVHGPYDNVLSFINGLQTGKRLFLVTGITSAKDVDSGDENIVTTKVTGQIYVIKAQ